jgi:SAM-dependent methyltransferase
MPIKRGGSMDVTPKRVPFSGMYTAHLPAINNKHRLKIFQRFIGWKVKPVNLDVLDVGARNFIGLQLGVTDFTKGDLNHEMRTDKDQYDVILCFEVLNHVMNHEDFLRRIYDRLKPGGKFYLSTPKLWCIAWAHGRGNYVELKPRSLRMILDYVGFKILREKVKNPWPLRFIFYGIRPPFRWIFNRFILLECEKPC